MSPSELVMEWDLARLLCLIIVVVSYDPYKKGGRSGSVLYTRDAVHDRET